MLTCSKVTLVDRTRGPLRNSGNTASECLIDKRVAVAARSPANPKKHLMAELTETEGRSPKRVAYSVPGMEKPSTIAPIYDITSTEEESGHQVNISGHESVQTTMGFQAINKATPVASSKKDRQLLPKNQPGYHPNEAQKTVTRLQIDLEALIDEDCRRRALAAFEGSSTHVSIAPIFTKSEALKAGLHFLFRVYDENSQLKQEFMDYKQKNKQAWNTLEMESSSEDSDDEYSAKEMRIREELYAKFSKGEGRREAPVKERKLAPKSIAKSDPPKNTVKSKPTKRTPPKRVLKPNPMSTYISEFPVTISASKLAPPVSNRGPLPGRGSGGTYKKRVNCEECGVEMFKHALTYHMESKHKPESEWKYSCETCGKKYPRKDSMLLHVRREHLGKKERNEKLEKSAKDDGIKEHEEVKDDAEEVFVVEEVE